MNTSVRTRHGAGEIRTQSTDPVVTPTAGSSAVVRWSAAAARLALGWVFLWAFLDKLLALGFSTGRNPETNVVDTFGPAAWIHDVYPTLGFLNFGTKGPLADFYQSFAGASWANWGFMVGLAGIGIALMLGIGMRIAAGSGVAMLIMMWSAVLPPENNPFMDDHLVYAIVLVLLAGLGAGRTLGLGGWWERQSFVQRHPVLK